jgi:hypothetical protein
VHHEVQAAELTLHRFRQRIEVRVAGHVAGQDERSVQARGQLAHILLETLALVGHGQPCPLARDRLGDAPGQRALVGDAEDETVLAFEEHPHPPKSRTIPFRRRNS